MGFMEGKNVTQVAQKYSESLLWSIPLISVRGPNPRVPTALRTLRSTTDLSSVTFRGYVCPSHASKLESVACSSDGQLQVHAFAISCAIPVHMWRVLDGVLGEPPLLFILHSDAYTVPSSRS